MKSRVAVLIAVAVLALMPATVQAQQVSTTTMLGACYVLDDAGYMTMRINIDEASGSMYFLLASLDEFTTQPILLGPFPLDAEGNGYIAAPIGPESAFPEMFRVDFKGVFLQYPKVTATQNSTLVFNSLACETFDPDVTPGGVPTLAGEILDEQWAGLGFHIDCISQLPLSQPNKACIFDSANPTGDPDTDLATPGYHPSNTVAHGKLMIVAENDVDSEPDGYIDDPDDAFNGGEIIFTFDDEKTICFATIIDCDDSEPGTGITKLRFYKDVAGTDQITAITVPPMGDNSAQTLLFEVSHVRRFVYKGGGSGAVANFGFCPRQVNFDTDSTGQVLALSVGEVITTQYAGEFTVSAVNQTPSHPNKAILFDTANPTGGDIDLQTPGLGIGNISAVGKVLIVAENDVDNNNDNLVDTPDDEATGGKIFFDFDYEVDIGVVTLLDTDDPGPTFVECVDENGFVLSNTPALNLGDNCSQTLVMNTDHTRKLKIVFGGSGGVALVTYCPCYCTDVEEAGP